MHRYDKIINKTENKLNRIRRRSKYKFIINSPFDKNTLITLHHLLNSHIISYVNGPVKAGKESVLFWAVDQNGCDIALKIYLTTNSIFKKRHMYFRHHHGVINLNNSNNMIELWARQEFKNLKNCIRVNIPVVKPIYVFKNILVLEFIGNNGIPNKTLAESIPTQYDYDCFIKILTNMYQRAQLVHGDLSSFNVFKTNAGLLFFDLSSSVPISHPNADMLLKRDIDNMSHFFKNKGLVVYNPLDVFYSVKNVI